MAEKTQRGTVGGKEISPFLGQHHTFFLETNKRSDRPRPDERTKVVWKVSITLWRRGVVGPSPALPSFPLEMEPHQFLPAGGGGLGGAAATATTAFDSPRLQSSRFLPECRVASGTDWENKGQRGGG